MDGLKGVSESAVLLGISPWTVRHLLRTGKLARIKVGRRVLIETKELERFIERCREAGRLSHAERRALSTGDSVYEDTRTS